MIRDLSRLANQSFDAIVVGGGIYGLTIAWDLALRGVNVALLERGDFAAATSFNSLKTIHGGIRPLQHGAVGETRLFVHERRAIARMAPHLLRPLRFVIPTYRHPIRNRFALAAFLKAYDRLAHDRNSGIDPSLELPPSRTCNRDEAVRLMPFVDDSRITGAAVWHDYQLHSPERFALALVRSMDGFGAVPINYVEVLEIVTRSGRVERVRCRDLETGTEFEARASVVVNAAGPWAWQLATSSTGNFPSGAPLRFSVAMNVVFDHPPQPHALGGFTRGRFLFMVPWRDRVIVGTSHDEHPDPLPNEEPIPALVDRLLKDVRRAFPRADLSRDRVTLVQHGLLPAGDRGSALRKHSIVHEHSKEGLAGLITVVGVRYTTARATAERVGDAVCTLLERPGVLAQTAETPLTDGDMPSVARFHRDAVASSSLPPAVVDRLVACYGTGYGAIEALIKSDSSLALPLSPTCEITRAEVLHSVRHELALHLSDALLRRTSAGAGGHPGSVAVESAADVMAAECGWTPERRLTEVTAVGDFYRRHSVQAIALTPQTPRPIARRP